MISDVGDQQSPWRPSNFVTSCVAAAGSVRNITSGRLSDCQLHAVVQAVALQCLQAFNWGGFDDGSTFLGGLYVNRSIDVGDMAMVVYRAQLLGFNAVRLPFRSDLCIHALSVFLPWLDARAGKALSEPSGDCWVEQLWD